MIINQTNYLPTYLTKPLRITIVKRFSGKKPPKFSGGLSNNNASKPLAPSSLSKTPTPFSSLTKPVPAQVQTYPSTNPPKLQGSLFKEHQFVMTDPKVKEFLESTQSSTSTFPFATPVSYLPLPANKKAAGNYSISTSSKDTFTVNTTTTTSTSSSSHATTNSVQPLNASLGALVLYKTPKKPALIQTNTPTIFIDPQGNAMFDINTTPLPMPITETTSVALIKDEILKIQGMIAHPPLEIPKNTQIPDFSQEKDSSVIKQEQLRLSKELPNNQLLRELVGRGFIKIADTKSIQLKTVLEESIIVGESPNNIKVTQLGKAYIDLVEKKTKLFTQSPMNVEQGIGYNLAALHTDNNALLLDGPQKHIVVVYDKGKDIYYVLGYLTSQSTSDIFAKQQFKDYQDAKEANKEPSTMLKNTDKPQRFTPCSNALVLKKDQLKLLKWDTNYIQDLPEHTKVMLDKLHQEVNNKPVILYDIKGFSKETIIKACIAFDINIKNKLSHPKTYVEIFNAKKILEGKEEFLKKKAIKRAQHQESYTHLKAKAMKSFNE